MYLQDVHVENYANRGKSMGMQMLFVFMVIVSILSMMIGLFAPPVFLATIAFVLLAWFI